jgi:RND family efflux transporter MFP subunit
MSLHSFEPAPRNHATEQKSKAEAFHAQVIGGRGQKPSVDQGAWTDWRSYTTPKRLSIIGVVVAVALGGVWYATRPAVKPVTNNGAVDVTVSLVPVTKTMITRNLDVNGTVRAFDELPLSTETSGIAIKQVLVDEGDRVVAGQLLARLNDDLLAADVVQKEALLREADANAAESRANARRAEELLKSGAISQRDADNRRALAATAEARVGVARATLEQSKARLRQADIRAPADGIISTRNARVGAVPSGGIELFRLLRDGRLELAAEVVERDLMSVKAGQAVTLTIDTPSGSRTVDGKVRLVSPVVDPKTRQGVVRIDVPNSDGLRAGMFITGRIAIGQSEALTVPEPTVVYQSAKTFVFTIDEKSIVHARQVAVGERQNGMIAITGPISENDKVVGLGGGYLKEGDKVVVVDKMPDVEIKPMPKTN